MSGKRYIMALVMATSFAMLHAQDNIIIDKMIKSLKVEVNNDWTLPPVIELNSNDFLTISFDRLTHEYKDLRYSLRHCNANWETSDMLEIDYMDGFNNTEIEDYETSVNTTVDYIHYSLTIPNENMMLKLSGNYILEISDYDNDETVASIAFSVLDKQINTGATVTGNTVIDTNKEHQQVDIFINNQDYTIRDPQRELKLTVMQNSRTDNMVTDIKPSFIGNGIIEYKNLHNLIFKAGNEYRRFEMLNENDPMMGVEKIGYYDPYYHATLYTEGPAMNYIYDQDQDGKFFISNNNVYDPATEADYMIVHFLFKSEYLYDTDIYINGEFTNNSFSDEFKMRYNKEYGIYEKNILLKQGMYNYMYLTKSPVQETISSTDTEGNFYETQNTYTIYVYHRPFGERYDRLIGLCRISSGI